MLFFPLEVENIAKNRDERDIFLIPPNFLNEGSLFGGMLKLRNAIEAVIVVVGITILILKITALSFTGKTIALCLTALPKGFISVMKINSLYKIKHLKCKNNNTCYYFSTLFV